MLLSEPRCKKLGAEDGAIVVFRNVENTYAQQRAAQWSIALTKPALFPINPLPRPPKSHRCPRRTSASRQLKDWFPPALFVSDTNNRQKVVVRTYIHTPVVLTSQLDSCGACAEVPTAFRHISGMINMALRYHRHRTEFEGRRQRVTNSILTVSNYF